jgi:hypothetical protein
LRAARLDTPGVQLAALLALTLQTSGSFSLQTAEQLGMLVYQ